MTPALALTEGSSLQPSGQTSTPVPVDAKPAEPTPAPAAVSAQEAPSAAPTLAPSSAETMSPPASSAVNVDFETQVQKLQVPPSLSLFA